MFKYFNLSISCIYPIIKGILKGDSIMRITHNIFLNKISLRGKIANLGSGKNYKNLFKLFKSINGEIIHYDFYKFDKNIIKIDLENKFNLIRRNIDVILLFNVLEHIKNYPILVNSLKSSLKKGGQLEIFVPFMYRYHEDPHDYYRPTHFYLNQILEENGFKNKITLIAAGQAFVVLEIIFRYLKFNFIKIIVVLIFLIFDKVFKFFSKDYFSYYCGVHISCQRIK
jgi:hypothetical protein